ncbi:MAG: hypothetical protein VW162_06975, partial [Alphaproteobacteria bacterium]
VGGSNPPLGTISQELLSQQNQTVAVLPSLFLIVTFIQILSLYCQSVTPKSDQRVTGGCFCEAYDPEKGGHQFCCEIA